MLFKDGTFFEKIICGYADIIPIKDRIPEISSVFFNNHFCDYLWAFSLQSGLFAIFLPCKKKKMIITVIVVLYGSVWELGQRLQIVGGTGDIVDILMYFAGSVTVFFINETKETEK